MLYHEFEWDDPKNATNHKKHGIYFSEAVTVWLDDLALEMFDPDHSSEEDRWIRIGYSSLSRTLVVIYCETSRDSLRTRIISARRATQQEIKQYFMRNESYER